jgi:succinyl-diaminopimelate desuccinylase
MTIVETLIEIVDVPSVTGDEGPLCALLEARFGDRSVTRVGNSLVVGVPTPGEPFFALYGHLDTVPGQGDPGARVEGDDLVGLGVSDMKGGVAVMIDLIEDPDLTPIHDVVLVFYAGEEGPADGNELGAVLDACPWLTDAVLSIVLEPTDLNVEIGCNGVINADVVFRGKSAHSARPWLGRNAITKAGSWLQALDGMEPSLVDIDGLEYREVFSVTRAAGGIANNIIPPEFVVNLNYRFPPIYSLAEAEQRLRTVTGQADEVVVKDRAPAGGAAPEDPWVRRLEAIAGGRRKAKQGWTDVARLTARGAVAVNYGPGLVAQAHQVGEYVPIENLHTARRVLRDFLTVGDVATGPDAMESA